MIIPELNIMCSVGIVIRMHQGAKLNINRRSLHSANLAPVAIEKYAQLKQ